jgi:hypothetical protein
MKITWQQALAWRMERHLLDPVGELPVEDVVRRHQLAHQPGGQRFGGREQPPGDAPVDRHLGRLCPLQNIGNVFRRSLEVAGYAGAITHQAAGLDIVARGINRGQSAIGRKIDD